MSIELFNLTELHLGIYDLVLLFVVAIQGTVIAFIRQPRFKAFVLSLPVPFTIANMALGKQVGTTHVLGLLNLLLFAHVVRWLHTKVRVPIVLSIIIAVAVYCTVGTVVNNLLVDSRLIFWTAAGGVFLFGIALFKLIPYRNEPGHRSELSVPVKFALLCGVAAFIVSMKSLLGGFMTVFPMVTVIACYESRYSLWTVGRQIPILMLVMVPTMCTIRLLQQVAGLNIPASLGLAWIVVLSILVPLSLRRWRADANIPA